MEKVLDPDWEQPIKKFLSKSKLLEFLSTVVIPATTKPFIAKDAFKIGVNDTAKVKISGHSASFDRLFINKVEAPSGDIQMFYYKLIKSSVNDFIISGLGGKTKIKTTLGAIYALMSLQPNKEIGALHNNGRDNIFYVESEIFDPNEDYLSYINEEGKKVVICAVNVCWLGVLHGWYLSVPSIQHPPDQSRGCRIFSCG
ncbi:MAG: hypothetical protein PHU42_04695 [Patescibacteria group bacterium]|nr:hypothetical protein [Patescibacteria group bacterium]